MEDFVGDVDDGIETFIGGVEDGCPYLLLCLCPDAVLTFPLSIVYGIS